MACLQIVPASSQLVLPILPMKGITSFKGDIPLEISQQFGNSGW